MGFLANLKNAITGGWANVYLATGDARRGAPLEFEVNVVVQSDDVEVNEVYVLVECREVVEIENYPTPNRDASGSCGQVDIRKQEKLFERRIRLSRAQVLEANSEGRYAASIELPERLPPTYSGKYARIEWRALAGLDVKGNDPDSGWQDLHVR